MESLEEKARRLIVSFIGPAFEEILRRNGGKYVVGNEVSVSDSQYGQCDESLMIDIHKEQKKFFFQVTWADLSLASLINPIIFHRPNFFDRLPLLYNHCKRIADMECLTGKKLLTNRIK